MPLADARTVVERAWVRAWERPKIVPVHEWAERHRYVEGGPNPGPWTTHDAPHTLAPMIDASEPPGGRVTDIVLMFPPQSAKTEIMVNALFSRLDQDPADSIFVFQNDKIGAEFCSKRLTPSLKKTPTLVEKLENGARSIVNDAIHFESAHLWFMYASSASSLSNKPARDGYFDEIDKWPAALKAKGRTEGSAMKLARARLDAFGSRARRMIVSTPTDEKTGIHAEFLASDQAERVYRCPHCGHLQRLRFGDGRVPGGVRFLDQQGHRISRDELIRMGELRLSELTAHIRRTAWYECNHCKGRIESWMRGDMLREGLWMRAGQEIAGEGRESRIVGAPADTGGIRGYHVSWLDVLTFGWGDVAAEWLKGRGQMTRDFVNSVMGEPYIAAGGGAGAGSLIKRILSVHERREEDAQGKVRAPVLARGIVPKDTALLIGSIDVQIDHIRWQVAAMGAGQTWDLCPRHLVEHGKAPWPTGLEDVARDSEAEVPILPSVREALGAVFARTFHVEHTVPLTRGSQPGNPDPNPGGPQATVNASRRLGVDYWFVDSGDRAPEVYSLCSWAGRLPGVGAVMAVKGVSDTQQTFPVMRSAALNSEPANTLERAALLRYRLGLELLLIRGGFFKDHIQGAIARAAPPEHPAGWTWYQGIEEWYIAELCAETRERVLKDGRPVGYKWTNKRKMPNHALDMTVYEQGGFCAILGVHGLRVSDAPRKWPGEGVSRMGQVKPRRRGTMLGGVKW